MAITSAGYAGTVNDLQWAQMARYFGMDYAAKTAADIACTQNGANKNFNIAAGEFWGRGIMDVNSAIVNVAPAVPAAGQWFLIVARRVWATKVTSFVAVASSTTTTATPTTTPAAYPAINTNPGVTDDQPLYWVWINSANTTTVVVDLRRTADKRAEIREASSDIQRGALFPAPVTGDKVNRTDLGIVQRWSGTAWRNWDSDWITFAPAWTNLVLGAGGTSLFRKRYVMGEVEVRVNILFGTGGSWASSPNFPLPDPVANIYAPYASIGYGTANDNSVTFYTLTPTLPVPGSSTCQIYAQGGNPASYALIGGAAPFTPTAGDGVTLRLQYTPA